MADEFLYSTSGDLRLSAALHQEMQLLLADRGFLWGNPAIVYYGDASGSGSTATEIPLIGLGGYDAMAAVTEGNSSSNTAVTDASPSITIARQALQRQISDINDLVDSIGANVEGLAMDGVMSAAKRFTEMVCNVADDFTSTVGTSGSDMTVDDWYDAMFTLEEASVEGPFTAVLYGRQLTDFRNDLRTEGGALQFKDATQDMLDIKGPGYKGNFAGVDIYQSALVPTANSGDDSAGGMWGRGAIGYKDGSIRRLRGAGGVEFPAGTKVMTEFERDAAGALTKIVHNYYVGVAIIEDGRGVSIITDR